MISSSHTKKSVEFGTFTLITLKHLESSYVACKRQATVRRGKVKNSTAKLILDKIINFSNNCHLDQKYL